MKTFCRFSLPKSSPILKNKKDLIWLNVASAQCFCFFGGGGGGGGGFPGYKPVPSGRFKICVGFVTGPLVYKAYVYPLHHGGFSSVQC